MEHGRRSGVGEADGVYCGDGAGGGGEGGDGRDGEDGGECEDWGVEGEDGDVSVGGEGTWGESRWVVERDGEGGVVRREGDRVSLGGDGRRTPMRVILRTEDEC